MADILLRGMEMPDRRTAELMRTELACVSRECDRHCENCDLVQDRDELIVAFHEAIGVLEAVANAVHIQEGHGRLIDGDALLSVLAILKDKGCDGTVWDQMRDIVENMVTIVPAEGGTDDDDNA